MAGLADEFEAPVVWDALMRADLIALGRRAPLAGVLGAIRMLPSSSAHLLHGERPPRAPTSMTLHDMAEAPRAEGGWILLGERSPGARSSSTRMRLRALIDSVREDAEQERD